MYIITDVKVTKTKETFDYIQHIPPWYIIPVEVNNEEMKIPSSEIYTELVKSIRFRTATHGDVYMGMTKQVQELLQIPLFYFDRIETKSRELTKTLEKRSAYIKQLKSYGFFKRLKCLFGGIK